MKISAAAWLRFRTPAFSIFASLLGKKHQFRFQGCKVTVALPKEKINDIVAKFPGGDDDSRADLLGWNDEKNKSSYIVAIGSVDVKVELAEKLSVNPKMLRQPPNAFDLLSEDAQKSLNSIGEKYDKIAEQAYVLWIRTLRWKSNNGSIGRTLKKRFWVKSVPLLNRETES